LIAALSWGHTRERNRRVDNTWPHRSVQRRASALKSSTAACIYKMHTPEDLLPIKTRPASIRNPELSYTFHHHPSPGLNSSQGRRTMSGWALCPTPSEQGKLGSCFSGARSYRPDLASYAMLYMPITHKPLWSKREGGGLVRAAILHSRERYSSFTSRLTAAN
jgi:hypothetical protein